MRFKHNREAELLGSAPTEDDIKQARYLGGVAFRRSRQSAAATLVCGPALFVEGALGESGILLGATTGAFVVSLVYFTDRELTYEQYRAEANKAEEGLAVTAE